MRFSSQNYLTRKILFTTLIFFLIAIIFLIRMLFVRPTSHTSTNSSLPTNLNSPLSASSDSLATDTADWPTFSWEGWRFKYPSSWKLQKNLYRTPSQQAANEEMEIIGYSLINSDNQAIEIGGRQADCVSLQAEKCAQDPYPTIYTKNDDPEVLKIFDVIVSNIQEQK